MATLATIRATIKTVLNTALGSGTEVYEEPPGNAVLPCVYLTPNDDEPVAMSRATMTWTFDIVVAVPSPDNIVGQGVLDLYVDTSGSKSIWAAIFNANASTFKAAGFDAFISAMTNYGGSYEIIGKNHLGATFTLIVHTSGTS